MSGNPLDGIVLPENLIRDFLNSQDALAADFNFDVPNTGNSLGLDIFIRNRGAAALTVSLNGQGPITVDAGDVYTVNNFKFWLVEIVSAVLYDLQIFGIRINTLKQKGLI